MTTEPVEPNRSGIPYPYEGSGFPEIDSTGAEIKVGQEISTKATGTKSYSTDTVSKSIPSDFEKLIVAGGSLKVDKPSIPAPRSPESLSQTRSGGVPRNEAEETTTYTKSISFLTILTAIMSEVVDNASENKYMQAGNAIREFKNTLDFTKTSSQLTLDIYKQKTMDLAVQAATSTVSTVVSGGTAAMNTRNVGKAQQDVAQMDSDIKIQEQKVKDLTPVTVTDSSGAPPPAAPPKSPELAQAETDLTKLKSDRETTYSTTLNNYNNTTRLQSEAIQSGVNAIAQGSRAGITAMEGQFEALKTMIDGYLNSSRTLMDNATKVKDQSQSALDQAIQSLKTIVSESYAAARVGRS